MQKDHVNHELSVRGFFNVEGFFTVEGFFMWVYFHGYSPINLDRGMVEDSLAGMKRHRSELG